MTPSSVRELTESSSLARMSAALPETLRFLEWDTQHFRIPIARVERSDLSDSELHKALSAASQAGIRLVYWFAPDGRAISSTVCQQSASLVDRRVTFTGKVDRLRRCAQPRKAAEIIVRQYPLAPANAELLTLAELAGCHSRFQVDRRIPHDRFVEFFHCWIDRSTRREIADIVFVAQREDGETLGFVTVAQRNQNASIGLIAVTAKAQRCGVGVRLLDAAHLWMADHGIAAASVVTQLDNLPACRLYETVGYERSSIEAVYHFWLGDDVESS